MLKGGWNGIPVGQGGRGKQCCSTQVPVNNYFGQTPIIVLLWKFQFLDCRKKPTSIVELWEFFVSGLIESIVNFFSQNRTTTVRLLRLLRVLASSTGYSTWQIAIEMEHQLFAKSVGYSYYWLLLVPVAGAIEFIVMQSAIYKKCIGCAEKATPQYL